jgi:hypothetical protein
MNKSSYPLSIELVKIGSGTESTGIRPGNCEGIVSRAAAEEATDRPVHLQELVNLQVESLGQRQMCVISWRAAKTAECGSYATRACRYKSRARLHQRFEDGMDTHHAQRAKTFESNSLISFKAMPNSYAMTLAMRLMLLPFLPI